MRYTDILWSLVGVLRENAKFCQKVMKIIHLLKNESYASVRRFVAREAGQLYPCISSRAQAIDTLRDR